MSSPVSVGETLAGKYHVERILGVGGMGVVVAARHLQLGERVAIKFLLPKALQRPDVVARFLREGQAAARIRSEHIARVFDVGTLDKGGPYLVMEYLEGSDLGAILRARGPLPIEEAVEHVLQACEALAEAHALGIIHRDLKPGNLFVTERADGSTAVKIIDFGISKISAAPSSDPGLTSTDMTDSAVMMGSPLYMAPEQMASARDVDPRADIWSLGIILYALLTGSIPFKATNVMEVYGLILQGAPPLRRLLPDAPEGLEKAIQRCLQKERAARYENVGDLATDLAPFGPPHARLSSERSVRILRAKPSRLSLPPLTPPTALLPTPAAAEGPPSAGPPRSAATPPPFSNDLLRHDYPEESLPGATTIPEPRRLRRAPLLALAAIGVVLLVAGLLFAQRGAEERPTGPIAASSDATDLAATRSSLPAAAPLPSGVAAEGAAPSVVPEGSPSPRASASAAPPGRPAGPGRSTPAASSRQAPRRDLFSDPR